ncbi:hypothetical protein SELMODRAFT_8734, partial [Selaginella moellendorffii]
CELILYTNNKILWSIKPSNNEFNCVLRLQEDGNLVLYSGKQHAIWASSTNCKRLHCFLNTYLIMQDDCNLVLYSS